MYVIKSLPEDFVVEEIPNRRWQDQGPYLVLKVTKRERNTEDVAQQLARQSKKVRKDVSYAGLKDKHAVTTQYFSIKGAHKNLLDWIDIDKVTCEAVGYTNEPLSLGSLHSNRFKIVVRNLDTAPKRESFFPNYFDEQRFSENNDVIGKHLVKGEYEDACLMIGDEKVLDYLESHPNDFVGALRQVPKRLLTLYVHAYQSRLFNRLLEQQVKEHPLDVLRSRHLPIVGFATDGIGLYEGILASEGVSARDFIIRELPDISSEGGERLAVLHVDDLSVGELEDDDLNDCKKKCLLSFSLPKGAYATNVVRWLCS